MGHKVIINDLPINVNKLTIDQLEKNGRTLLLLDMEFQVTSEEYHDVTVTLYKNDFIVQVPKEKLEIEATIYNYYTSVTDLYEKGNVGDFRLVLLEKS